MENKEKKVIRKTVIIKDSELTKKELQTHYNKFQLFIAKLFKLVLADSYQYLYRISYYGSSRLKVGDIIANKEGVFLMVINETNRIAMLVTKDAFIEKPKMYGQLTLISRRENTTKIK